MSGSFYIEGTCFVSRKYLASHHPDVLILYL